MMPTWLKPLLMLALAILVGLWMRHERRQEMQQVLRGLRRRERAISGREAPPKVAVGFGIWLEGRAPAAEILAALRLLPGGAGPAEARAVAASLEQMERSFAFHLRAGASGSAFLAARADLAAASRALRNANNSRWMAAGPALAMAQRARRDGAEVLLGARTAGKLQRMLGEKLRTVADHVTEDDVHVVLEAPAGLRWGDVVAPRGVRFVLHRDKETPSIGALESLKAELPRFDPDALLITGLSALEAGEVDREMISERLSALKFLLSRTESKTRIHFQMEDFKKQQFYDLLVSTVLPYADSIAASPQQLSALERVLTTGQLPAEPEAPPTSPPDIFGRMRLVAAALRSTRTSDGRRLLSRLHVRSAALQAVFIREDHKPAWKDTGEAAAKAALVTAARRCAKAARLRLDDVKSVILERAFPVSRDKGAQVVRFNASEPVSCWREGPGLFCVAPALSCAGKGEGEGEAEGEAEEAAASALLAQL